MDWNATTGIRADCGYWKHCDLCSVLELWTLWETSGLASDLCAFIIIIITIIILIVGI